MEGLQIPMYSDATLDATGVEDNHMKEVNRERLREKPLRENNKPTPQCEFADIPMQLYGYEYPRPSIIKNYTVNMSNPLTSHSLESINSVYQDILLPSITGLKFSAIRSRENIYQVIRNTVIGGVDGKEVNLASKVDHSLMTQLKLLELAANPLRSSDNLYKENPFDMIIVRCGYPIRYQNTGQISLAKENISTNLRLYNLDNAEYNYTTLSFFSELQLLPWRELMFYRNVSRMILQTLQSPHFVMLYGYLFCRSNIRFDTFNNNRNARDRLTQYNTSKRDRYENKLISNRLSLGIDETRVVVDNVSTWSILMLDNAGNTLCIRNQDSGKFKPVGGILGTDTTRNTFKKWVANSATQTLKARFLFTPQMLIDANSYDVQVPRGTTMCRVFVVITNTLPRDIDDTLVVEMDMIDSNSDLFEDLLKNILTEGRRNGWPRRREGMPINVYERNKGSTELHRITSARQNISPGFDFRRVTAETLASPSGRALILVTESPTHNILQWCSKKYTKTMNVVRQMTRLGIYTDEVWLGIYFQILQGAYVMIKNKVGIKNMSLKSSVFIKDTPSLSNQFWIYVINGSPYYLPHQGYIVQYDIGGHELDDFSSKVVCEEWGDHNVSLTVLEGLRNIVDPSEFSVTSLPSGCNPPSKKVLDVLGKIHNKIQDAINTNTIHNELIPDIMLETFPIFYHPRIGTDVTSQEQSSLDEHAPRLSDLKKGEMLALLRPSSNSWVWAYYVRRDGRANSGSVWIVTSSMTESGEKVSREDRVSIGFLRKYRSNREIDVFQDRLTSFNYDTLLERYTC
jgi:hypothetical protein